MGYFIALDAGGTKTETLLLDESGRILLRDISLGCNAMDMGLEEALRRAVSTLRRVAQHIPGGKPDYAFCGIASMNYYGEAMRGPLRAAFADWPLYLEDDGWGMISSMLGQAPGCCIVCGTGCSLFARTPDALYHIGGLGYLIDTVGSGFILGRDAILAAIKQVDGRGPKTVLYDLVRAQMGGVSPEGNIPAIYSGGRPYIASFAHCVFEGRRQGDCVSREIFERGSTALSELTWAAERYFPGDFDVVMSGGIFAAFPEYARSVTAKASPRARMIRADVPPVFGCALEAVLRGGAVPAPDFRTRFMAEYAHAAK